MLLYYQISGKKEEEKQKMHFTPGTWHNYWKYILFPLNVFFICAFLYPTFFHLTLKHKHFFLLFKTLHKSFVNASQSSH